MEQINNNPDNILQAAQQTEQAFNAEISQTPKAALPPGGAAPAAEATPTPPPQKSGGIFGKDFYANMFGNTEKKEETATTAAHSPQPTPEQPAAKEPYQPFQHLEEAAQPQPEQKQGSGGANLADKSYLQQCRAVEKMKNMAMSRLLAALEGTDNFQKYKLSPEEEAEMAEALNAWHPTFVSDMPDYAQYAITNATIYGPMLLDAYNKGQQNRRNARIKQDVKPRGNVVQFTPAAQAARPQPQAQTVQHTGKGERTRFEIHSDCTYAYTRAYPDQKPVYLKIGSAECEKIDLQNTHHLQHIIMKNGGWRKVANKLGLSEQWMESRGLNKNTFEIAD